MRLAENRGAVVGHDTPKGPIAQRAEIFALGPFGVPNPGATRDSGQVRLFGCTRIELGAGLGCSLRANILAL